MLPVNREAAVFVLLLDETRTVFLEVFRIPPGCMEGKYSPCRRIRPELTVNTIGNPTLGKEALRKRLSSHSLQQRAFHECLISAGLVPGIVGEPLLSRPGR